MSKKNPFFDYGTDEIIFEVAKDLDLSHYEYTLLMEDEANGRIDEWIEIFNDISNDDLREEVLERYSVKEED